MKKLNVNMADGSVHQINENGEGEFEMLCPCGMTLPMTPASLAAVAVPLMCPCGRQYDLMAPESGEVPADLWEREPEK